LLDPEAFAEQIRLEGLAGLATAFPLALGAIGLEVGLGVALVLGVRRPYVLIPAALLIGLFLVLTGRAYWHHLQGREPLAGSCGCFGALLQRSPAQAFWQDLLVLGPLLGLAFVGRPQGAQRPAPIVASAVLALFAVGFAWRAPALPLDDLATRLRPGVPVAGLCAGAGGERVCLGALVPELERGAHVVVLADLEDEGFASGVPALNDYAAAASGPPLWVLTASEPEVQRGFFWRFGPAFEIREAPAPLLRSLYRRLPRSFMASDGAVVETYSGMPPLERLASSAPAPERLPDTTAN
jgi:hypothetical protein